MTDAERILTLIESGMVEVMTLGKRSGNLVTIWHYGYDGVRVDARGSYTALVARLRDLGIWSDP